jgi:hypothetical protein
MKSHPRVLVRILFCAALALCEFGCGSRPVTVTVTPASATVAPGAILPLSATSSNNSSLNWLISCFHAALWIGVSDFYPEWGIDYLHRASHCARQQLDDYHHRYGLLIVCPGNRHAASVSGICN